MSTETAPRQELWNKLIDRDLDRLISGKPPSNDDLAPLESFVISLNDFADVPVSAEFLELHAGESAATVTASEPVAAVGRLPRTRTLALGVKKRVVAGATTLMMILGMTGVAWAADSAVPGDWNYGIDRALEAVGIGAGGADERLNELAVVFGEENPGRSDSAPGPDPEVHQDKPTVKPDIPGPDNAATTVAEITEGNNHANEVRSDVSELLEYLASIGEIDAQTVAGYARQLNPNNQNPQTHNPEQPPGIINKPAETGKPSP